MDTNNIITDEQRLFGSISTVGELRLACENVDIKSIPFWKGVEDELGGKIIFRIKPRVKGKRVVDILCYTFLSQGNIAMNGVLLYTKWEFSYLNKN